jgi:uncharacterized protein (DUF3084 family)
MTNPSGVNKTRLNAMVRIRPSDTGNLVVVLSGMLLCVSVLFALFWIGLHAILGKRPSLTRRKQVSRRTRALGGSRWNRPDIPKSYLC